MPGFAASDRRRSQLVSVKWTKRLFRRVDLIGKIFNMKTPSLLQLRSLKSIGTASFFLMAVGCGLFAATPQQYIITDMPSLGGTVSRANSINNRGWLAGYSTLPGNQTRHAALWRDGEITDLGTLGGPNSAVTSSVKSNSGLIVGIAQTNMPDPLGEFWSSSAFY